MSEAGRDARAELDEFLSALGESAVRFFPVRHHSPACAWHVRELIRRERPRAVLIEGPEDITPLIPFILNPETRAPFAVYATHVDERARNAPAPEGLPDMKPSRSAGYYPFCDYSPELVALRAGAEVGARLRFIDLTYPEQVSAELGSSEQEQPDAPRSLQDESYLKHSRYINALARKAGCRDHDDLWDHLFEASFLTSTTDEFVRRVAAYCFMARFDYAQETLERDGTLARERAMAEAIVDELESGGVGGEGADGRPLVVVTGGFHTAALPGLIFERPPRRKRRAPDRTNSQTVLTRYSFDQLDRLNGYASGMPSPDYYQRLWQHANGEGEGAALDAASRLLVEVGRLTRERDLEPSSPRPTRSPRSNRRAGWPVSGDMRAGRRAKTCSTPSGAVSSKGRWTARGSS